VTILFVAQQYKPQKELLFAACVTAVYFLLLEILGAFLRRPLLFCPIHQEEPEDRMLIL
jgi:hypothetical protein